MAEAVAKVHNATPAKEATARSGSRSRSRRKAAMDDQFRFTGSTTKGLTFERRWTTPGVHPYDEVEWELRDANIANEQGESVFEQKDVEVPEPGASWPPTSSSRSTSAARSARPSASAASSSSSSRVVDTITDWGATHATSPTTTMRTSRPS